MPLCARGPTSGTLFTSASKLFCLRMYTGLRRTWVRLLERFDTVGAYERPLSFSTMITPRPLCPRLFNAS
jgi:hypothetical protein